MFEERARGGWWWVGVLAFLSLFACKSRNPGEQGEHPVEVLPAAPDSGTPVTGQPPPAPAPRDPWPQPEQPPITKKRSFPLKTPALGGYALRSAFSSDEIILPNALVWPKAGARPFELDRLGRVLELDVDSARVVLDFSSQVALRSEDGALGLALHPEFGDGTGPKAYAFIWYNAKGTPNHLQRLSRFTWDPASRTFLRASELMLVEEPELRPEHNAGHIQFGPDGFLYFGNGDDINPANHQRLDRALFAGIFRIDVDSRGGTISHPPPRQPEGGHTQGYYIPNDNPFVGVPNAMEEFYALGFRNPYGFSFDRATGELWLADVGDTWREEVNLVLRGGNYEWPYREGELVRGTTPPSIGTSQPPKFFYTHAEQGDLTSVLGGYVYRGHVMPELTGLYIYSDWPSCRVWALKVGAPLVTRKALFENQRCDPTALAEDPEGELYLLQVGGISKLVRDDTWARVPSYLSQTTLFDDTAALTPSSALVPYQINSPLWSDGAAKQRWISVPDGKQVTRAEDGSFEFPVGTLFVKQFDLPDSVVPQGRTRRLETRVLVVGEKNTYGLSYRWNAWGTDASLVYDPADQVISDTSGGPERTWHYPGFGQCWACHRPENRVLGFTARQLNRDNQLDALASRGVFAPATIATAPPGLSRPSDTTATLEQRATAYLAANCSGCHHPGAEYQGGEETWNALPGVALADRRLLGAQNHNGPVGTALNLRWAPLIDPGHPENSFLLARMKSANPDLRMPPLARNLVDPDGVALIEAWIASMPQ